MQRPTYVSHPVSASRPYVVLFVGLVSVVDFDPTRYGRVPHPDAAKEAVIEDTWAAAVAARPATYNATKFRLAGVLVPPPVRGSGGGDGAVTAAVPAVKLQLGLTDYRTYVGTHLGGGDSPMAFWGHPRHLALALGNAAVVVTSDGRVPLLRRSAAVAEGRGRYVVPGGHPEPSAMAGAQADRGGALPADPAAAAEAAAAELTASMAREIVEELYLPPDAVPPDCLVLLGGVARGGGCGRPQLCYTATLDVCSAFVEASWAAGVGRHAATVAATIGGDVPPGAAAEAVESTELVWLDESDMGAVTSTGETSGGGKLMPEHWGAVALYWASRQGGVGRAKQLSMMDDAARGGGD